MKWTNEANEAIAKVPFCPAKGFGSAWKKKRLPSGAPIITLEHVKTCQKRFLNQMEDELKGYQVEACFGPTGCPKTGQSTMRNSQGRSKTAWTRGI